MRFNPQHKEAYQSELAAVKWLIKKAEVWEDAIVSEEFGRVRIINAAIDITIPWHMSDKLRRLAKAGYKQTGNTGGVMDWETANTTQHVSWTFGQYKSNQNRVHFCYTKYEYLDCTLAEIEQSLAVA